MDRGWLPLNAEHPLLVVAVYSSNATWRSQVIRGRGTLATLINDPSHGPEGADGVVGMPTNTTVFLSFCLSVFLSFCLCSREALSMNDIEFFS